MNPVNWFEIPAKDLERAKEFYSAVFGLEMQFIDMHDSKMYMFHGDPTHQGSLGCIYTSDQVEPSANGTTVYFSVEDCDVEANKAAAAGGTVVLPKMSIGEFGFIAQVMDTEGNRIGIHSQK